MPANPQSPTPNPELDSLVRHVDEDRWLASRFAPAFVRERLIPLYAVNHEIARGAEVAHEPALGAIRLEWWRSALDDIAQSRTPPAHPALEGLRQTLKDPIGATWLQGIVAARAADLEARPFETWEALETYLDETAGALLALAIDQCAAPREASDAFITAAGRAWGYAGLLRARAHWRARGRSALPTMGGDEGAMCERARAAHAQARALSRSAPSGIFPAIGYVALVPAYLRALQYGRSEPSLLQRQIALVAASAGGRL